MEDRRHGSAAARARPTPFTNNSLSVLHSLQSENESLRSELLRSKQQNARLEQQLDGLRASTDQVVREATAAYQAQARALEDRCRLLADRLVASKRDEQVSESARVGFVLRAQLEERRFLKRGLMALASAVVDDGKTPEGAMAGDKEEVHTGTLSHLVMAVSDAFLSKTAAAKLEKARTRLSLEHTSSLLDELHGALEDATRAAFDAAAQAAAIADAVDTAHTAGAGPSQLLLMRAYGTPASALRNGFTTPSPLHHRQRANADSGFASTSISRYEGHRVVDDRDDSAVSSTANWATPLPAPEQLAQELEWVCDVLKACMHGLEDMGASVASAKEELQAPPLSAHSGAAHASGLSAAALPLAEAASPEMNGLLSSFLNDLHVLKQRSAQQQQDMARQLAHEVDQHYQSTQQYEERIKLLESECARLLRYAERVAEEQTKASAPSPATVAATPAAVLPSRQDASVSANTTASLLVLDAAAPAAADDEEIRATPERYTAKPANATPLPEAVRPPPPPSLPQLSSLKTNVIRGTPRQRRSGRTQAWEENAMHTSLTDVSRITETDVSAPVPQPTPRSFFAGGATTTPQRRDHGTALTRPLPSPRRTPPADDLAPSTSAAAAAFWSQYVRQENAPTKSSGAAAVDAVRRRLPRESHLLLSPAPPPRSDYAPSGPVVAPAGSTSPWRRSITASIPSGWTGGAHARYHADTTTLSSVSSTSERFSPLRATQAAAEGLVSSYLRTRSPRVLSSPEPPSDLRRASDREEQQQAATPPRLSPPPPPPLPPRDSHDLSVASSRAQNATTTHTRLSQQLYDEAAADVFSSDSTSFLDGPSTMTSPRQHHHRVPASAPNVDDESPEVRPPSARRPIFFGPQAVRVLSEDAARTDSRRIVFTPPVSDLIATPSPPHSLLEGGRDNTPHLVDEHDNASGTVTPPIWRRIKEESASAPLPPQTASPLTGNSDLFGTPPEASWIDP